MKDLDNVVTKLVSLIQPDLEDQLVLLERARVELRDDFSYSSLGCPPGGGFSHPSTVGTADDIPHTFFDFLDYLIDFADRLAIFP